MGDGACLTKQSGFVLFWTHGADALSLQVPCAREIFQLRPYLRENNASRPICEFKHGRAQSVLWWVTTWEYWVP
ncbi:hypothetical protein BJ742DRAFT_819795 [Cladochytrium replicatum]|nr:hypothetical protein BJ742DRAFT_819795 [Cladochytrium replicatum]